MITLFAADLSAANTLPTTEFQLFSSIYRPRGGLIYQTDGDAHHLT